MRLFGGDDRLTSSGSGTPAPKHTPAPTSAIDMFSPRSPNAPCQLMTGAKLRRTTATLAQTRDHDGGSIKGQSTLTLTTGIPLQTDCLQFEARVGTRITWRAHSSPDRKSPP